MKFFKRAMANRVSFMLLLISISAFLLFSLLATLVANGMTLRFDASALMWINAHADPALDSFFVFITRLGGVLVITIATIILFVYFIYKKAFNKAVLVALGVAGASALGFILKALFERTRPDLWDWLVTETYFSFPSGHATGSSALALCIILVLWQTKWRLTVLIAASIYIVTIGFSRLYLGVHYPTDILAGWLLSIGWVALVALFIHIRTMKQPKIRMAS